MILSVCTAGISLVVLLLFVCKVVPRIIIKKSRGPFTADETRLFLFVEDVFVLTYYLTALAYLSINFIGLDFFWEVDISNNGDGNYTKLAQDSEPFILMNAFFYFGLLYTLFIRPTRGGNWYELLSHHIITLAFIYAAYVSLWRVASVWVLAINIMCDVFVQLSQIAHRAKSWLDIPLFAILIGLHAYTRLYVFPFRIYETVSKSFHLFKTPLEHVSYLAAIPLYALWVMWFFKMLMICYKRLWLKEKNNDYAESKVE